MELAPYLLLWFGSLGWKISPYLAFLVKAVAINHKINKLKMIESDPKKNKEITSLLIKKKMRMQSAKYEQ